MRVLHVVATGQRRGAEIFTADLVGAMNSAEVDQRVAIVRAADGVGVQYGVPMSVLGSDGSTFPGLRMNLSGLGELRRVIRSWDPDVIQAHGGEPLKYSIIGSAQTRARVVYRRIGSTPPWIARGPRRMVYGSLMRKAVRVVAVAEAVREETLEVFRLPATHVVTIPNAVDARRLTVSRDREAVRRAAGIPLDAEIMLSLGALTWEKDPLGHVEIATGILAERPRAWHVIVGDGPLRGEVEAAVRQRGTGGRVRLLGVRDDVANLFRASDVLLFASSSEGMPATVIEAGMAGLPVAAYAVAGVAEVIESGVTGRLAPAGDARRLQADVAALLGDDERRRAMSAAARRHCLARFDIGAIAPRYLDLYRAVTSCGES
jgi:glycosyltransferase involved in cell wall biosynthesis